MFYRIIVASGLIVTGLATAYNNVPASFAASSRWVDSPVSSSVADSPAEVSTAASAAYSSEAASPAEPIKEGIEGYVPTAENLAAREKFRDDKFGIFIHWGVYSMLARGEWVMNEEKIKYSDYSLIPGGFFPSRFDAAAWVSAIKASGARYITITSRHHDGFSMFKSAHSAYNIVDATPFGRDILKELADQCRKQGITLNFYYSLLDWGRGDYPAGSSGNGIGKKAEEADYGAYFDFMCGQISELLTGYGPVGSIWFDGDWDQIHKGPKGREPEINFDWRYGELYSLIHGLQPACLVANNHHRSPIPGEDTQVFERDLPGENSAGFSKTSIISDALPLETCQTMNGSWGFNIRDHRYKTAKELIRSLVSTAGRNANLLLNIGPRSDGRIPDESLALMAEIGKWLSVNGETVYCTRSTLLPPQAWGVVTHKDKKIYLHVLNAPEGGQIILPPGFKAKKVSVFGSGEKLAFKRTREALSVVLPPDADFSVDFIVEIEI